MKSICVGCLVVTIVREAESVHFLSEENGPLHYGDVSSQKQLIFPARVENSVLNSPREDVSWSRLFRNGVDQGLYTRLNESCYKIPVDTPLALAVNRTTHTSTMCFIQTEQPMSFLQTSDAYIYKKAQAMTSDERAELQETLKEKRDKWPDDLSSKGPKASADRISEPAGVSISESVDQAISRAKDSLASTLRSPRDSKAYVYPLMIERFAELIFVQGCIRNYEASICPIDWTLKIDGAVIDESNTSFTTITRRLDEKSIVMCHPPVLYRGLCGEMNFTNLLRRQEQRVVQRVKKLASICWFEFPCDSSVNYQWEAPCPDKFRLLTGRAGPTLCLRRSDESKRCAPYVESEWPNTLAKVRYSYMCAEAWPLNQRIDQVGQVGDLDSVDRLSRYAHAQELSQSKNGPVGPAI